VPGTRCTGPAYQSTAEKALFKVIASDGVNTGQDQSDATFRVARKAPQAFIIAPDEGAHFLPEQQVILAGEGYDVEDGSLPDSAFTWILDGVQVIGTGPFASATGLPIGWHELTLRVADSNGQVATELVHFYVGTSQRILWLPVLLVGE